MLATQIDHPFEVQATWGKFTGKLGDFLVKNFQDRETAYSADMWIVDQTLFRQTYESVAPGKRREIVVKGCPNHLPPSSHSC